MVAFPDLHHEYKSKPGDYFSHLIGHEGEHSLLSYLKKEGLALSLSTWPENSLNCFSFIQVDINLTKKGLEHYDLVLQAFYTYARNLEAKGPQEYCFEEVRDVGQINFNFASK